MHDPFGGVHSQQAQSSEVSHVELMRQEEKQPVHEKWWILSIFAAVIPFGLTFSSAMSPIGELMKQDIAWAPAITDEDIALLDGAIVAPSVIMPVLIGIALDAAWSVNLGLLTCLVGSVVAEFLVALGIAWHSFGLALTGRVIAGFSFGSIFVVADTIAAQFNRKRRATTFGLIGAVQTIALHLNVTWMNDFTIRSLDSDYEKMNDVLLIATLVCLGIGFLWSPLVSSYDLGDAPKRRFWKWHLPLSVWALVAANVITVMYHQVPLMTSPESKWWETACAILVGPALGYYMDMSEKSQAGSFSVTRYLIGATCLVLLGHLLIRTADYSWGGSVSAVGLGLMYMLLRSAIPQVASRDNLSTSFGLLEGSVFAGGFWTAATQQTFVSSLIWIFVQIILFVYVMYKVSEKWELLKTARRAPGQVEEGGSGRFGELSEPLHTRGA